MEAPVSQEAGPGVPANVATPCCPPCAVALAWVGSRLDVQHLNLFAHALSRPSAYHCHLYPCSFALLCLAKYSPLCSMLVLQGSAALHMIMQLCTVAPNWSMLWVESTTRRHESSNHDKFISHGCAMPKVAIHKNAEGFCCASMPRSAHTSEPHLFG